MKSILAVFLLLFSAIGSSAGVRVIGNPAGFIENQMVFTWGQLASAIEKCLNSHCANNEIEKNLLTASLPSLKQQLIKIEFQSEKDFSNLHGHLFSVERKGPQKLITFNTEEFYRQFPDPIQFSFLSSLEIFLNVFKAEFSNSTDSHFKELANSIYLLSYLTEENIDLGNFGLSSLFLKISGTNMIFVSDASGLKEVTALLNKRFVCPNLKPARITKIQWLTVQGFDPSKRLLGLDTLLEVNCLKNSYVANVFVEMIFVSDLSLGQLLDMDSVRLVVRNLKEK